MVSNMEKDRPQLQGRSKSEPIFIVVVVGERKTQTVNHLVRHGPS